jgi:hypothetical protein
MRFCDGTEDALDENGRHDVSLMLEVGAGGAL